AGVPQRGLVARRAPAARRRGRRRAAPVDRHRQPERAAQQGDVPRRRAGAGLLLLHDRRTARRRPARRRRRRALSARRRETVTTGCPPAPPNFDRGGTWKSRTTWWPPRNCLGPRAAESSISAGVAIWRTRAISSRPTTATGPNWICAASATGRFTVLGARSTCRSTRLSRL